MFLEFTTGDGRKILIHRDNIRSVVEKQDGGSYLFEKGAEDPYSIKECYATAKSMVVSSGIEHIIYGEET